MSSTNPAAWPRRPGVPVRATSTCARADFFNVAEFPEAVYKSSKFNFNGDNLESVEGTLTLLGVTKPVKLTLTAFKCAPHPFTKKDMCGADAATSIKRSDFGMKTMVGPISDEVKLTFGIEAYKE